MLHAFPFLFTNNKQLTLMESSYLSFYAFIFVLFQQLGMILLWNYPSCIAFPRRKIRGDFFSFYINVFYGWLWE